jgi:hypothetical protein
MKLIANFTRPEGDPKVLATGGPSSLTVSDRMAKALGWFSIGLGAVELFAPHRITRALGMRGSEGLVRAYGAREIAAGMMTLSVEKPVGLMCRVAGDALDIATLMMAYKRRNRQRDNVATALGAVIGITLLDIVVTQANLAAHARGKGDKRDYTGRSGFPRGLASSRGIADGKPRDGAHLSAAS